MAPNEFLRLKRMFIEGDAELRAAIILVEKKLNKDQIKELLTCISLQDMILVEKYL